MSDKQQLTEFDKWLDTLTDADLDNHSQRSLASEAWTRGVAHAAQAAYSQAIEDAKAAIRSESNLVNDPYAAATFINAIARKCSPHRYVASLQLLLLQSENE